MARDDRSGMLRTLCWASAFGGLAATTRAGSWGRPVNRDVAQYLYVGDVLLGGGAPYLDAANNKGPLLFALFAGLRRATSLPGAGGSGRLVVRSATVLAAAVTACAVADWTSRRAPRAQALAAGAAFAALSSVPAMEGDDPNSEHLALVPAAAAVAATAHRAPGAAAAGALVATAVLMNPALVMAAPLVAGELWWGGPRGSDVRGAGVARRTVGARRTAVGALRTPGFSRFGLAALGALVVTAPTLGWLARRGALREALRQIGGPVARSTGPDVIRRRAAAAGERGERYALAVPAPELWVAGLAGAGLAALDRRTRSAALGAGASSLLVYARIKLWGHAYPHHWVPALPGLATGIALGGAVLARRAGRPAVAGAALGLLDASVLRPLRAQRDRPPADPGLVHAPAVARALRERTPADARVLVTYSHPSVLVQARRRASTRFFDVYPTEYDTRYAAERRRALLLSPPDAIARLPWDPPDPDADELLERFADVLAWEDEGARVWLLDGDRTGA